ncbi:MAG TPA: DNA recombination protein RmuC, partial [Acidobacteriota bacterium]|nr:DNA recombination protein RmuC [Acidobacteriota bacterium]
MTLRRVVELAGMSEHCDFSEQVTADGDGGKLRPDLIVRLPAGREIVVDAKVSLEAYLDAVAAESEEARKTALTRHAAQVRNHMNILAEKQYWQQFTQAPEFVVMFIPGESF